MNCVFIVDVDITGEIAPKSALKHTDTQADHAPQPTATGRTSVTFARNTAFDKEKTGKLTLLNYFASGVKNRAAFRDNY